MTLIHNTLSFPGNIHKILTPNTISPYLQIIEIKNAPLAPHIIINMYMPLHPEDIALIDTIKDTIETTILANYAHIIILLGDFNRGINLIGRYNNNEWSQPTPQDLEWHQFITSQQLTYNATSTNYSRQGGEDYTSNSLIDGFYIKCPTNQPYTSTTITNLLLN